MRLRDAIVCTGLFLTGACGADDEGPEQPEASGGASGNTFGGSAGTGFGGSAGTGGASPGGSGGMAGAGGSPRAGTGGNATGGNVTGGAGGGNAGGGAGGASAGSGGSGGSGPTFSIRFDYRFDTAGFFSDPVRRSALEAAGAMWSRVIRDEFEPIPAGTSIRLFNPENRDEYVWVDAIEEDIDDLIVFVGTSEAIAGLGRGGPSGTAETDDLDLAASLVVRRDGPDFEPWAGSITFKASSNFFFDPTPETSDDIPAEAYDFTSNAAHELGHVLGFGTSMAFDALVSGTTFTGPIAVMLYGEPVPLETDAGHFLNHVLFEGEETLMDPGQYNGVRLVPTRLDLAVMSDMGFEIVSPP
jgi:hypothetical protein